MDKNLIDSFVIYGIDFFWLVLALFALLVMAASIAIFIKTHPPRRVVVEEPKKKRKSKRRSNRMHKVNRHRIR